MEMGLSLSALIAAKKIQGKVEMKTEIGHEIPSSMQGSGLYGRGTTLALWVLFREGGSPLD